MGFPVRFCKFRVGSSHTEQKDLARELAAKKESFVDVIFANVDLKVAVINDIVDMGYYWFSAEWDTIESDDLDQDERLAAYKEMDKFVWIVGRYNRDGDTDETLYPIGEVILIEYAELLPTIQKFDK